MSLHTVYVRLVSTWMKNCKKVSLFDLSRRVEAIKKFVNDHILERSVEYDNLSSAVHGGPFGESALFNLHQDQKKYDETLYKFANESSGLHYSIVQSTYLFAYLMDEKMQGRYEKIKTLTQG